jgi:hypothetical protein
LESVVIVLEGIRVQKVDKALDRSSVPFEVVTKGYSALLGTRPIAVGLPGGIIGPFARGYEKLGWPRELHHTSCIVEGEGVD